MTRYAHVFRLFTAPFVAAALMLFLLPIRCFAVTLEELENIEAQREVLETRRDNIEKKVSKLVVYAENALNDSLPEEAVQDTFRIACSKYDELMNSSNPQGWLMNTLKNVIRNIRKEQANLNKYFVMTMSLDDEEFMEVCAVGTDVHKRLEDTEVDLMYSDLLTEEEYRLLTLIVRYRYSILEAALEFGINIETCKKRIQRVKKKLRKILEKDD